MLLKFSYLMQSVLLTGALLAWAIAPPSPNLTTEISTTEPFCPRLTRPRTTNEPLLAGQFTGRIRKQFTRFQP